MITRTTSNSVNEKALNAFPPKSVSIQDIHNSLVFTIKTF
jgi:hypothetical protein